MLCFNFRVSFVFILPSLHSAACYIYTLTLPLLSIHHSFTMDPSKTFSLLFLLSLLSISSAAPDVAVSDCGFCKPPSTPAKKPTPTLPVPPVGVPKLPLPPVGIPKLPLPPVGIPKLPLPPVGVPKLPLPPVGVPKLPLPPVGVPKLPLPPVGVPKLPLPPVGVPKLPLPPVGVPKLPLPPVGIPKLPLPPLPNLPLPPVVGPPAGGPPKGGKSCPPPPPSKETCPIDTLKLGACVDLLGGLVHVGLGDPAVNECCPIISGLVELEAAACLCTTLKLKALNLKIFVPIALELLVTCGKTPPPGYTCSL